MSDVSLDLKGVTPHIGLAQLGNNIEANFKEYFQYALLKIGGFTNISIPTSGIYSQDFSRLRPISDPNYSSGQVWGSRKDWVYETGIYYENLTGGFTYPTSVSVTVNGISNTGYFVDYPNGQVIFNSPVTGTVKANYSYRNVQLYKASEVPQWKELQQNSFRTDSVQYLQSQSGVWSLFADKRIQLPAIIIETIPVGRSRGVELGGRTLDAIREVQFTILSDNDVELKNLIDIVNLQSSKKLKMFDINEVDYPLNYRGQLTGTSIYTNYLTDSPYIFRGMYLSDSRIVALRPIHPKLFTSAVVTTVECLT